MSLPSCLGSDRKPLVIDASVAINLAASGIGSAVLIALPRQTLIVDIAAQELRSSRDPDELQFDQLKRWESAKHIEIVSLDDASLEVFESLVVGSATNTLDDGEAATIAVGITRDFIPVIDERKANRICQSRFMGWLGAATIDLFADEAVVTALGKEALAQGVFNALRVSRMRVLPRHLEWTIGLIGVERAVQCPSLPQSIRNKLTG